MTECFPQDEACVAITPSEVCLRIVRGTDSTFVFVLTDGDGNPIDLSSDTVKLTVRDYPGGTLKVQKTNGSTEHLDPTNGRTQFTIEKTDIVVPGSDMMDWVYEVRRIDGSGKETVHIAGRFLADPQVGA